MTRVAEDCGGEMKFLLHELGAALLLPFVLWAIPVGLLWLGGFLPVE